MLSVMYLLVRCFVAMRDLVHWQHWNNPPSPWRGGTRVHLQLLIDSPLRTLQGAERQIEDVMRVNKVN